MRTDTLLKTDTLQSELSACCLAEGSPASRQPASPEVFCPVIQKFGGRFSLTEPSPWRGEPELGRREEAGDEEVSGYPAADFEAGTPAVSPGEPLEEERHTIITLYLREIGRVKLLTPQEEVELAARIKQGDAAAREQMIKANLRLVVKIARGYAGLGMPLLDLISEGNIGLMKAVERFDPAKGGKLSTYSAWWIRQTITRALASQSKATRLPSHVMDKLHRLHRASARLQEELGREPTQEELAGELGTTVFGLSRMRMAASGPVSLDAGVAGDESRSYAETIADEQAEPPYQKLESEAVRTMIRKMIETLTRREQAVLAYRFGLDGREPRSLEETGNELKITDERVRQIQCAALGKLRRRINQWEQNSM